MLPEAPGGAFIIVFQERKHYKTHRNQVLIFPAPGRDGILERVSKIPLPDVSIQTVLKNLSEKLA